MRPVKLLSIALMLTGICFLGKVTAQIKIGTNGAIIAPASLLELESNNQGLLLPRLTDTLQINALIPPDGMLVYITKNPNSGLYIRKGGAWVPLQLPATNANLTGVVTSLGNVTAIANGVITNSMLANAAVASLTGTNTGDQTATTVANVAAGTIAAVTVQGALNELDTEKAPLVSPTFTGTVTAPTFVGTLTGNATTATSAGTVSTNANLTGVVTSTGNATTIANGAITNVMLANTAVANLTGTNTGDQDLSGLAPKASPTFTGTVSGITAGMVGLGNVSNIADADKPVSTLTQSALDLKAPLASPDLTGVPTAPTALALTNTTQVATTAFVTGAVATAATPDADGATKGKLQLAGDLSGTAASPTITNTSVIGKVLTGYSAGAGTVVATDNILQAIQKLDANTAGKQNTLTNSEGLFGALADKTGTGLAVFSTSPILTTPQIKGSLTGKTILANANSSSTDYTITLPAATGTIALKSDITASNITGIVAVANGGTGATNLNGLIKGNGTSVMSTALAGTDYQAPISLSTTSNSGAATFASNTLNIPNYTLSGLGGISLTDLSASTPLTYDNTTGSLSIQIATALQNGYLASSDFTRFNNKQTAINADYTLSSLTISGNSSYSLVINDSSLYPWVSGLVELYPVVLGLSNTLMQNNNLIFKAWVSNAAELTIRLINTSSSSISVASQPIKIKILP